MNLRKKNICSRVLLTLVIVSLMFILLALALKVLKLGVKSGKYYNPNVASRVVEGTIYDRNGRALSMPVTVLDAEGNQVSNNRVYPANFHASQLIDEIEEYLSGVLSPLPAFGEAVTYANDIYLTIDLNVQFVLDLAVQDVYKKIKCKYITAFILDSQTGEYLGVCNYPYYDLNNEHRSSENRTFLSNITIDNNVLYPFFIKKFSSLKGEKSEDNINIDYVKAGFTSDYRTTVEMISSPNNSSTNSFASVLQLIPKEKPACYVFIGVWTDERNSRTNNNILLNEVSEIESGLKSQGFI